MKTAILKLRSLSPYSQSRMVPPTRGDKEDYNAYEQRSWIEKGHYTADGDMFIPPMALLKSVQTAARELGMKIPGRGKKTYKTAFNNGLLSDQPVLLGVKKDQVRANWINANADGVPGSGKRVPRAFPTVDSWKATWTVMVLNDAITEDVFRQHVEEAGKFVGIGQFRPENRGYFGRFEVVSMDWK